MKYSLLTMTQAILSSMDSDEVNNITDTVEATQVATVIRTAYLDMVARAQLPEQYELFNLAAKPTGYPPTCLRIPDEYNNLEWIKYDTRLSTETDPAFTLIPFISREEFLDRMHSLVLSDDNVESTLVGTVRYMYVDDAAPTVYTTFDDNTVMFDSYDSAVGTGVVASRSLAYGRKAVTFTLTNAFAFPELDDEQHTLLLNEAKALAWFELKQSPHQKAEINTKRGWTRLQRTKDALERQSRLSELPNYGRK
jgi:hypothetical protein